MDLIGAWDPYPLADLDRVVQVGGGGGGPTAVTPGLCSQVSQFIQYHGRFSERARLYLFN